MKLNNVSMGMILSLSLVACSDNDNTDEIESNVLNEAVKLLVSEKNITAISHPENIPAVDSNIVQLGKKLFFTKALSGNMDTACASCHHPNLGGGDDLALPIGVEALAQDLLGPGRLHDANGVHHDGGPTVPRNAPTTFNFVFYNKSIFHDGRIENNSDSPNLGGTNDPIRTPEVPIGENDASAGNNLAAAQARFPVTSHEEMRGFEFEFGNDNQAVRLHLEQRFQGKNNELATNDWLSEFRTGFDSADGSMEELVTFDNIAFAMGEYERSQILINNPWAAFLNGEDNAVTDSAKRGALLFYNDQTQGGFNCVSCHSGSFFTDEEFHVIAIPQVGRGKGDGLTEDDDFGRFRETGIETDKYAFRTPHLLNVTDTGPWGHNGAFDSLSDMVKHHLNPVESVANYDPSDLQPGIQTDNWQVNTAAALTQLADLQSNGVSTQVPVFLVNSTYTEENITDLLSFLQALEDPCTQDTSCMNKWVPATDEADPDGLRLIAVNEAGDPL